MTLGQKQEKFSRFLGQLLAFAYAHPSKIGVRMGECYRPPEMAEIYAAKGMGIKNSLHTQKLAVDVFLSMGGQFLTGGEPYKILADYWKSLDPDCCWGGDFTRRDVYHYSLRHNGVK